MPTPVDLSPRYVRSCRKQAAERNHSFQKAEDWYDEEKAEGWGYGSEKRHFIGLLGEIAFAEHYDLQIDTQTYTRSDRGVDFRVHIDTGDFDNEIMEVDVKSSPADDPQLFVTKGQVDADYYVLCRVHPDALEIEGGTTVKILGGATKEMILNPEPIQSDNYGHYYYSVNSAYLLEMPSPKDVQPVG